MRIEKFSREKYKPVDEDNETDVSVSDESNVETSTEATTKKGDFPWWIALAALGVALVAGVAIVVFKKKK